MPRTRGKANKSCQTDTVYLSEDQVEKIINQHLNQFEKKFESLLNEIKDLKAASGNFITKDSEVFSNIHQDISDLKSTSDKLTEDSNALNNLQQAAEVQAEEFQEKLDIIDEENSSLIQKLNKQIDANKEIITTMHKKTDEIEQNLKMKNLRIAGVEERDDGDLESKVIGLAQKLKMNQEIFMM